MLIIDLYSLLPAFMIAGFVGILLWPENIAYKMRLRLFIGILLIWILASVAGMLGYGTTERPMVCLINAVVGGLGLLVLCLAYQTKPSRRGSARS